MNNTVLCNITSDNVHDEVQYRYLLGIYGCSMNFPLPFRVSCNILRQLNTAHPTDPCYNSRLFSVTSVDSVKVTPPTLTRVLVTSSADNVNIPAI